MNIFSVFDLMPCELLQRKQFDRKFALFDFHLRKFEEEIDSVNDELFNHFFVAINL